jgi:CRP/FNR family cyclic AMP-dependent transcriptional regulator
MSDFRDLRIEAFEAGTFIFKEGDRDFHFYILQEGCIEIFTHNANGEKIILNTIEEGEAFGEFSLLTAKARSASAIALTDCVVVQISDTGYQELIKELPDWANSMMRCFVRRIQVMNEKIKALEAKTT